MSSLDTTQLENIANLDFATFRTLASIGQNRAEYYYQELETQAQNAGLMNVQNYATLADSVVTNSTINGIMANNYTEVVAEAFNIDFSPGSEAR